MRVFICGSFFFPEFVQGQAGLPAGFARRLFRRGRPGSPPFHFSDYPHFHDSQCIFKNRKSFPVPQQSLFFIRDILSVSRPIFSPGGQSNGTGYPLITATQNARSFQHYPAFCSFINAACEIFSDAYWMRLHKDDMHVEVVPVGAVNAVYRQVYAVPGFLSCHIVCRYVSAVCNKWSFYLPASCPMFPATCRALGSG